ncbi:MAG: hypothetical protein NC209_00170 [Alistipes sp.]|nr:hypothetical protein [Alistipes senegalensis]MCM1249547.1 hypothetical protein [Alistipes sp.]
MKTIFTTFVFSLALCAAVGASAQTRRATVEAQADTVMLSETTDGDYVVRRGIVERRADSDYSVRYLINLSTLNAALGGNPRELDELNAFVSAMMNDSLLKVNSVVITGYASPDGPAAFNEQLARNRARDFRSYVDSKYGFSKKFDVRTESVAEDWAMCRRLVAESSMPDKQAVLRVMDGPQSSEAKEHALKQMPAAWNYMAEHILPPVRRVAMTINYDQGSVVEQRTRIVRPKPVPAPAPQPVVEQPCPPAEPCCCDRIDESITGIIVEMPDPDASAYSGNAHHVRKAARRDIRADRETFARDSREAERIDREAEKAERKIAKKEAKAARKADKASRKIAREMGR